MKKSDFISQVAEKAEMTKDAATRAVEAIFDATSGAIAEAVRAGEQVSIPGFGKFKSKTRAARKGRNPQTGAEIDIPERTVVQFTPGKGLQDMGSNGGGGSGAKKSTAKKGAAAKSGPRSGGSRQGGAGAKAGGQRSPAKGKK